MRYELSDYEWVAIKPMLPNKLRGVRCANERRALTGRLTSFEAGSEIRDRLVKVQFKSATDRLRTVEHDDRARLPHKVAER